jgi:hypothetical protein
MKKIMLALLAVLLCSGAQAQMIGGGGGLWSADACQPEIPVLGGAPGMRSYKPTPWFVDSVNGLDTNHGRSSSAPLQTITALLAKTIYPGQAICLARGSTWREKLTVPANAVTVQAYGIGNRPVLDASDVIAAGAWTKTGGRVNVYQASLAVQLSTGTEYPGIWVNGTRLTKSADLAALDAAPGTYYHAAAEGVTPLTLYIHSTGSTDPTSDGKTYEAAMRSSGLDAYAVTGVTARGIAATKPYSNYGGIVIGQYGRLIDCYSSEGNTHNFYLRAYAEAVACEAVNAYAPGEEPILYVYYELAGGGASVRYTQCTATSDRQATGFGGHDGGGATDWATVTYDRCTVTVPAGNAFAASNTDLMVVTGGAVTADQAASLTGSANISDLAYTAASGGKNVIILSGVGKTVNASRITATIPAGVNAGSVFRSTGASTTVTLTDNVLLANYAGFKGAIACVRLDGATSSLTSLRNSWGAASTSAGYVLLADTVLSSDYNTWQSPATFTVGGVVYPNLADYKAGTGQDAHSTP